MVQMLRIASLVVHQRVTAVRQIVQSCCASATEAARSRGAGESFVAQQLMALVEPGGHIDYMAAGEDSGYDQN